MSENEFVAQKAKPISRSCESLEYPGMHAEETPNPPRLFENLFPDETTHPHGNVVITSKLLRVRGAQWYDYVVLEDGTLKVGQRMPGQGHSNLAQGQPVQAAEQVQVSGGRIIEIDNASGHYLPSGQSAQQAAIKAFQEVGFEPPHNVYVEKVWNPRTQLWEPVNGRD